MYELAPIERLPFHNRSRRPRLAQWFLSKVGLSVKTDKVHEAEFTYRGTHVNRVLRQLGEYRTEPVNLETLDLMRHHPIVKLGLTIKAAPILTALREAKIQCDDPRIKAFVEQVFVQPWLLELAQSSILPAYVYGCAPHEKVWAPPEEVTIEYVDHTGNKAVAYSGPLLTFKKIKFVHPKTIDRMFIQSDTQDFRGFVQKPPPGETEKPIEAWKAFLYVNRFIFGGLWGESELRDVYPFWYYSEFFRALWADYLRFKAIPPLVAYAPTGVRTDENGQEVDNMTTAGTILQKAWDNLVVVLPHEIDDKGNRQWSFEELKVGEHGEAFSRAIEDLDVQILRGLIVPERTVTQDRAAVGSYNLASIHEERMLDAAKMETNAFCTAINKYILPVLIEDHFGPNTPPCMLYVRAVSEALKQKLHSVLITVLQNDREGVFSSHIGFTELLDELGIPYVVTENKLPEPVIPEPEDDEDEADEK